MTPFAAWVFALLLFVCPLEERAAWHARLGDKVPVAQRETPEERADRYVAIAVAIAAVVTDPDVPPLFAGTTGRLRTTELLVAVAKSESDLRRDVDRGEGPEGRGDHGRSWCLFQIQAGTRGHVPAGPPEVRAWTGADLVADHRRCVRAAVEMLRVSLGACRHEAFLDRLSAYTTGRCQPNEPASRRKLQLAYRLQAKRPRDGSLTEAPPSETASPAHGTVAHAAP